MTNQFQLAILEAQQSQLRATYYAQRIQSGAWRDRIGHVFHGSLPEHGGVPYTEDEVLKSELATMHQHIQLAQEYIEHAKGFV